MAPGAESLNTTNAQDACTLWPDTLFGVNYTACCYAHDRAYEMQLPRLEADIELGRCVAALGLPVLGNVMALGVILFGYWAYRIARKRKHGK